MAMTPGETLRYIVYHRLLHPAFAFIGASAIAALPVLGVISFSTLIEEAGGTGFFAILSVGLFLMIYIAAYAALPACLAIWTLRAMKLPRGWSDAIAGAVLGGVMAQLVFFGLSGLAQWPTTTALLFALSGLIGGLAYWVFTGRPRPPYGLHPA